jgi:hypothetical protein
MKTVKKMEYQENRVKRSKDNRHGIPYIHVDLTTNDIKL